MKYFYVAMAPLCKGRIMSSNIGPGAQNLDAFDEMDTKSLQNFFLGTAPCDLMNELGTPYGM